MKCFWCDKEFLDSKELITHSMLHHPDLNPRSYDAEPKLVNQKRMDSREEMLYGGLIRFVARRKKLNIPVEEFAKAVVKCRLKQNNHFHEDIDLFVEDLRKELMLDED